MGKYIIAVINKLNQCLGENEIGKIVHKKIMESGELIKGSSKTEEISE
jgi:hypothetical protein